MGLLNLINPTFAVVMGGLAIGRCRLRPVAQFMGPLLVILTVIITLVLSIGAA